MNVNILKLTGLHEYVCEFIFVYVVPMHVLYVCTCVHAYVCVLCVCMYMYVRICKLYRCVNAYFIYIIILKKIN